VLRRVVDGAPAWLAPGGRMLVEAETEQAPVVAAAMSAAGLTPEIASSPEWYATVVIGTRAVS
jgi:release factor glutamine methyltransferase